MNDFLNLLLTQLIRVIGFISSKLSINTRIKLGKKLGNLIRLADGKRKGYTIDNIRHAFPEKSIEWQDELLIKTYHNLGIVFSEIFAFHYLPDKKIKEIIQFDNIELMNEVLSRGKGLIMLSGHYGNWELLAYSGGMYSGSPIMIIVKPQQNIYADELLNKTRTKGNNSVVSMYSAARTIVNTLRSGNTIALLADQSATSDKDVYVDFFGREAATYEAPASLALKFKTPILMGFAVRQREGNYIVKLREVKHDDLNDSPEGILELTRRHTKCLEEQIRERPELWVWQHRRWKHQRAK
jgi:Kdo2-lipid IVA lauroyltransferase/acyltransferase